MKTSTKLIMFLMLSSPVWANDIYVTQSGNNLVLDITQSGTGNTIGTLNLPSSLTGAGTDFTIVQNGNTNELTFEVNGNNYTVTATINLSGNSNTVSLSIGENDDSTGTTVIKNVTGDSNTITSTIDSPNAEQTLTITGSTNTITNTMDGSGVGEHKLTLSHTGTGGTFNITQEGLENKTISLTTSGNNPSVTIVQED